jgi:hypothetical protein
MDSFLATLAPTIATLLAILLAAVTAYFVFLRERTTDYSDRIFDERLAIREHLEPLSKLQQFDRLDSLNFARKYRVKYPTKSRVDLVTQLASQLFWFDGSRVVKDFIDEDEQHRGESWKGRLYYFFLKQTADIIAPQFDQWRPRRETFPFALVETGFEVWRSDFEKLGRSIKDAIRMRQSMTKDFGKFSPSPEDWELQKDRYASAADEFFAAIGSINASLSKIDKLKSAQNRYISSGLHIKFLLFLCLLSFVFGVLVPLAALAFPGMMPDWMKAALGGVAMLATILSSLQFGRDLFRSPEAVSKSERNLYVRMQWYAPIIDQMKSLEQKFSLRGPLDLDFFSDAKNSGDLSVGINSDLDNYLAAASKYNEAVKKFDDTVLTLFERDEILGHLLSREFWTKGGRGLSTYNMLSESVITDTVSKLFERPEAALSISTFDSVGTSGATGPPKFIIPAAAIGERQLLEALQTIRKSLSESPVTMELQGSHQLVAEAESPLRKSLNGQLGTR